jgi:hypothetical protein
MTSALEGLEEIAQMAKNEPDISKFKKAIQKTRDSIKGNTDALSKQLDSELIVWQAKLDVILGEPVARQGMANHAKHWIEKFKRNGE